jgi:hypothetical protein
MIYERITVFGGLGIGKRNGSIWGKHVQVPLFLLKKTYVHFNQIPYLAFCIPAFFHGM